MSKQIIINAPALIFTVHIHLALLLLILGNNNNEIFDIFLNLD